MNFYFYFCCDGYRTRSSFSNKIGTNLFFSINNIPIKNNFKSVGYRPFDWELDITKIKYLYKMLL